MAAKLAQLIGPLACFQLPDAVPPSLKDRIIQLQIAERPPQRRLPLCERFDAFHIGRDNTRPNYGTLKQNITPRYCHLASPYNLTSGSRRANTSSL